jgi:1-acyl-sn-glycerol-3-phosphate acyltransferase
MTGASEDNTPLPRLSSDAAGRLLTVIEGLVSELHRRAPAPGQVTLDTDLDRDLGMDSLGRVELLARIEKNLGVRLEEDAVVGARTPRDVLSALGVAVPDRPRADHGVVAPADRGRVDAAPAATATLVEALEWHAAVHPGRAHIRLYDDDTAGEAIDYRTLLEAGRRRAAALQGLGVQAGQPVVLMLQTGADYFFSFFGALLAGAIPVPIYPPARPSQLEDHVRRQRGIIENCGAPVLVTMPEAKAVARLMQSGLPTLGHVVTPAELDKAAGQEYVRPAVRADDLALLQYTSGSTGQPKGVMLTHANLLANIRLMVAQIGATSEDVFVSWLPLYHDMGLIGAWLGSLYCAAEFVVMSPLAFIARPERWLWAIHRHRATLSAAPNFGYELCLRRLDDDALEGLDLSSWRIAFNGAEPISPDTLRRFAARFGRYGLRPRALTPVYGLAECSLGLTFPPPDRGPLIDRVRRDALLRDGLATPAAGDDPGALEFVSCGAPIPEHEVRIVADGGRELPEREVGRLQFKGPSATRGYYRNAEASRALLRGEWRDSGDLAYVAEGEVYLTGRVKDVVIHAGRNLYPHELEEAVGRLPGVRAGRVAVFGARDAALGTERLVVVAEAHGRDDEERRRLHAEINRVATELTGGPPDDVVLAPPGTILKTPSGKVRRAALRERYEQGDITSPPPPPWRQLLGLFVRDLPARTRRLVRRAAAAGYSAYALLLFGLATPLAWLAVALLPTLPLRWQAVRAVARTLAALAGMRLTVRGREHLSPPLRPCVLVANHASYLDGAFLALAFTRPVAFAAKAELRKNPFLRLFLSRLGVEFVERLDARQGVEDIRSLTEGVRRGRPLLFFPEGTFTRAAGLRPFRMGAFVIAAQAGVPVVPLALRGTRSLLRSGSWWPNRGRVVLTAGAPIPPEDGEARGEWAAAVALRDRARAVILEGCGEPDLAADRTRPWLAEG